MVSVVSLWEIAIKANLGKLEIEGDISRLHQDLSSLGIRLQPILIADLDRYLALPLHHRDPFDRLLIAQALVMDTPIISADTHFDAYEVQRLW
jgi:PIN domain nuclease of toxin-antitoxin system